MRIVLQRVKEASVTVGGAQVGSIKQGLLLLIGVHKDDSTHNADACAAKCADLRIFDDYDGKMNLSLRDSEGSVLAVSQFTVFGDCRKGRRPGFSDAAPPEKGRMLYDYFVEKMKEYSACVETGIFGAMMEVSLVNDGPVTLIIEK